MNTNDSGLAGRTETKSTTEQMIDYSPKEYTWTQNLVSVLKILLIALAVTGLLWGVEKFLYK